MASWGTLPGAYAVDRDPSYIGGKPIELMQAIIRDYTRPGDLVCDPCAGNATTGVAARQYDRRFIGAEAKATVHAVALERLGAPVQMDMFSRRRMVIGEAK
jgi:DNA modification methylase